MSLSEREAWTILHGTLLGTIFLLAFAGGLAGLYRRIPERLSTALTHNPIRLARLCAWLTAAMAWLTVLSGTFVVYPWYRDGTASSPRAFLLASPGTAEWHAFGMEWKEHVGWLAAIAATVVAYAITYYGPTMAGRVGERRALTIFYVAGFSAAAIAGMFGAFINKVAPIR